MAALTEKIWRLPALLLILAIIPLASAGYHFFTIFQGIVLNIAPADPIEWLYINNPVPILLHLVPMVVFCVLGPWQLTPAARRRFPKFHRMTGRVYVVAALSVGLSGLYMNVAFPSEEGGLGRDVAVFLFGIIFVFGLLKGVLAARDRKIAVHRAWMIRVYAIGIGATTQRLLILPVFLTTGTASDHTIAAGIWAGWIINLLIAEWIIRRKTNTQITEVAK